MRDLVRGGIILIFVSLCFAMIFAQSRSEKDLSIANESQPKTESTLVKADSSKDNITNTKLVKTTGMVRAAGAASRGAFIATAYCLRGRTATGGGVRRGVIAADPRLLRLGSQVLLGAGSYTGQYTVSDTGGAVHGRHIDIWVPTCAEARRFGRRTVLVSMAEDQ